MSWKRQKQEWKKENLKDQSSDEIIKRLRAINQYLSENEYHYGSDEYNLAHSYCLALFEILNDRHDDLYKALTSPTTDYAKRKIAESFSTNCSLMRLNNLVLGFFKGVESGRNNLIANFGSYRDLIV